MKRFLLVTFLTLLTLDLGCTRGLKPPASARPKRTIDWQDPVSVMRGFLAAKRAGDWRTAYRCCDYDETLPKEEKARIKKNWKEECKNWPIEYMDTFWAITGRDYVGETASVRILVSHRNPITSELKPGETYEERLKLYNGKWKITNPLPPETPK